jgi:hypothetical protein
VAPTLSRIPITGITDCCARDQYCYYTEASDTPGRNVMLDIRTNGKLEKPKILPNSFDVVAAFSNCVWFRDDDQ